MFACKNGHLDLAMLLIDKGADISIKDNVSNFYLRSIVQHMNADFALVRIDCGDYRSG